jgi:D-alanyl-D-alanine carboxypeptidase/D-alanyl-D-alanine-endopeptidase (penicillin-binding protein 4)
LKTLGENYRFKTLFILDKNLTLFIQGWGDPFLTSEELEKIGRKLALLGIKAIKRIVLDDSLFNLTDPVDGTAHSDNPYDAPNSALAVNFNSVPVFVSSGRTVSSGEPQTPDLPIMKKIPGNLPGGFHRINIEKFSCSRALTPSLQYAGELFAAQFKKAGIEVGNTIHTGKIPGTGTEKVFYTHYSSKPLQEIVRACLRYSNNFIANQLFLTTGAVIYGYPATWQKSRLFFQYFIKTSLKLPSDTVHIIEGSGLSRKNRITPAAMLEILKQFSAYRTLLNEKEHVFLKSGTLRDVFCYAGYLNNEREIQPFVVMLNQSENTRTQVLQHLKQSFLTH